MITQETFDRNVKAVMRESCCEKAFEVWIKPMVVVQSKESEVLLYNPYFAGTKQDVSTTMKWVKDFYVDMIEKLLSNGSKITVRLTNRETTAHI